ncbi:Neprosin [Dillenia turbinata]|uniref:Neprosin n=1 Tax=Dillenia turbinata TaxID=194707 RepID=A0AAN8UFV1_9MAGN
METVQDVAIGYWPKALFTGLGDKGTYVEWGGQVFSLPAQPSPPMGSGFLPSVMESNLKVNYCTKKHVSNMKPNPRAPKVEG